MQKQVKIINVTAANFGIFKAVELDLTKFKNGVIALKGQAGQGKSTIQNAIKVSTQGRATLADADQYGNDFVLETQLLDGDRKIFVGASNKDGKITYKLYEKDSAGKKVSNPIIDGVKATPAKYMDLISTELTFGIRRFLSDDNTTQKKFMFELFRPELEKMGVIFDKKNAGYEKSILGELDALTITRDNLRAQCTHRGAFATDFERDGHKLESVGAMEKIDVVGMDQERTDLLVQKGQAEGNANAEHEKAKAAIAEKGQKIVADCRAINERLMSDYEEAKNGYDFTFDKKKHDDEQLNKALVLLEDCHFLADHMVNVGSDFNAKFLNHYAFTENLKEPADPTTIPIVDGKMRPVPNFAYPVDYAEVTKDYISLAQEFQALKAPEHKPEEFDQKISALVLKIENAKVNNDYVERYQINREWVEAAALVNQKRNELAKLYAGVDTGVNGLKMKPFFEEDGKMDIKTVYDGSYDYGFFKPQIKKLRDKFNDTTSASEKESLGIEMNNLTEEQRLLVSYSSTQKPLIGILLQVARLKTKEKVLPYVFLDDVPMDKNSRSLITRIADENKLTIITSITGDFQKDKLTENELLIEGGEVFFSEDGKN